MSIPEEEWPPINVATVTAVDPDSGENGRISYHLAPGGPSNVFEVDSVTGEIHTVNKLDREKVDSYTLVIQAVDHVSTQELPSCFGIYWMRSFFWECYLCEPNVLLGIICQTHREGESGE
mgnify:CR=1 FL=1